MKEGARQALQDAIQGMLDDGEIAIAWSLTVDVASASGDRYLAQRTGGGIDGEEQPMSWTMLGMLHAAAGITAKQVVAGVFPLGGEVQEDEDA